MGRGQGRGGLTHSTAGDRPDSAVSYRTDGHVTSGWSQWAESVTTTNLQPMTMVYCSSGLWQTSRWRSK